SIAPARGASPDTYGPGFLGPQYAPLLVGTSGPTLEVQDLSRPPDVAAGQAQTRLELLLGLEGGFVARHPDPGPRSHQAAYERAIRLMSPSSARAFKLDEEPAKLRDGYGRNRFGQGCLLARRLVERGVPFVEVTLGGWDTHFENFEGVKRLSPTL